MKERIGDVVRVGGDSVKLEIIDVAEKMCSIKDLHHYIAIDDEGDLFVVFQGRDSREWEFCYGRSENLR